MGLWAISRRHWPPVSPQSPSCRAQLHPKPRRDRCPFFCWYSEGQNWLHNAVEAPGILTLWFASKTCSCYQHRCSCLYIPVHSQTPLWDVSISLLKEETQSYQESLPTGVLQISNRRTEVSCLKHNTWNNPALLQKAKTRNIATTTKCPHDVP